jgi:hypothetical protein
MPGAAHCEGKNRKETGMPHIVIFLLGAGAAALFKAVGGPILRPVVKGVVKTGIILGRQA